MRMATTFDFYSLYLPCITKTNINRYGKQT